MRPLLTRLCDPNHAEGDEPSSLGDLCREAAAEIERLTAENERLRSCLKECADDLEAHLGSHYVGLQNYPSERRRYERDMEPVRKARELCAVQQQAVNSGHPGVTRPLVPRAAKDTTGQPD